QLQNADPATRRGMARGFVNDLRDQVLAVLTPEQAKQFNENFQNLAPTPTTQPAIGQQIERLYDFVTRLDLDDEQKKQVDKMFSDRRQQILTLRQNPPGDGTMPQKIQGYVQELRGKLSNTLSQNQQLRLRQEIEQDGMALGRGGGRGDATPPTMQPET